MKPVGFLYFDTGVYYHANRLKPSPPDLGDENVQALVDAVEVEKLRRAAAVLNEAFCTHAKIEPASPKLDALQDAIVAWREVWLQVDGKILAIGELQPTLPSHVARAFPWRHDPEGS